MKIFNLPDLGEGLAEAEIREWHIAVGDLIEVDQPLVSMETAKAVVEVPSPETGRIAKLYGQVGDIINTHAPLVAFEGGTVVGSLEEGTQRLQETGVTAIKAMPAVRALAKQLQVDLSGITPSGPQGQITAQDVKKAAESKGASESLHGVRRAMALTMAESHQAVVPVTLTEDADISDLAEGSDITVCCVRAMVAGIKQAPALNAWFLGKTMERRLFEEIHIGLAMDTEAGLFVPVLKNVASYSPQDLRTAIDRLKKAVHARTVTPNELQGATLILSNFGMMTGRYATPIIVPPMVSILGCGKIREEVKVIQGKMAIRRIIPLSLTFDHRAVTGGEATRFLAAFIHALEGK